MAIAEHYAGREQALVKHQFLETYLTDLLFKVGSFHDEVVYVDGYSGPWQSTGENFEDTSFGIAVRTLREVKEALAPRRNVRFRAILVEANKASFHQLSTVPGMFSDIPITLIHGSFLDHLDRIHADLGSRAFAFFFIDPWGWKIDTKRLGTLLSRPNSEVVFNFMFDFINRAAMIPSVEPPLDLLFASQDWKDRVRSAAPGADRKAAILGCFREALQSLGRYPYCLEAEVMKATADRLLYALVYATRHPAGVEVFRNAQVRAYRTQDEARAGAKLAKSETKTKQPSFFTGAEMTKPDSETLLATEAELAADMLLALAPVAPRTARWEDIATATMAAHVIRKPELGRLAGALRKAGKLHFPAWGARKQVPDADYRVCRPTALSGLGTKP